MAEHSGVVRPLSPCPTLPEQDVWSRAIFPLLWFLTIILWLLTIAGVGSDNSGCGF